jgi:hypothetical protein
MLLVLIHQLNTRKSQTCSKVEIYCISSEHKDSTHIRYLSDSQYSTCSSLTLLYLSHTHLQSVLSSEPQLTDCSVSIATMPDIYAYNNKRYERFWLGLLGAEQLQLDSSTFVIADGTAADAVLRFAERSAIAGALLIGAGDSYHAAERHGRAYVWSEVCRNSGWLGLLYCSERPDAVAEGRRVQIALAVPDTRFNELTADVCSDESSAVLAVSELMADYCSWRTASASV